MSTPPQIGLPTSSVDVGGTAIEIRSMTRAQAYKLRDYAEDENAAEVFVISCGTGWSQDDTEAFRNETGFGQISPLVDAILELSGLKDAAAPKD